MRRQIGISGIQRQAKTREEFQKLGNQLAAQQLEQLQLQLATFKTHLQEFATKYAQDIRKDPTFRQHFHTMCLSIGVDPLASNKGFWSELLGVGDFYYELSVQMAQVCFATRSQNGGFIELEHLLKLIEKLRNSPVTEQDIVSSIKVLKPLGNGFALLTIGDKKIVQSVPIELNQDFKLIMESAQQTGYTTVPHLMQHYQWSQDRATQGLDNLLKEGICWIDTQVDPHQYWINSS